MAAIAIIFQNEEDARTSEKIISNNMNLPTKAVDINGKEILGMIGTACWSTVQQKYNNPNEWWFVKPEDKYLINVTASYQTMLVDESFYPPDPDDP